MSSRRQDNPGAIRFYGRRHGHALRPGRRQLVDSLLPKIRIAVSGDGERVDLERLFDSPKREYWMEIGFGSGEHLAALAERYPDIGFIGCEPFVNGVAALLAIVDEKSLSNVRIFNDDVHLLFPSLPFDAFHRIYLPYADPWPKKRHHRRRMVQAETVQTFARLLKDHGEFRFASDHMGYVRWVLDTMGRQKDFTWMAQNPAGWRVRPHDSIETRYEAKAKSKGAKCVYLQYQRGIRPT